jgi:lipopolysaccharide/colanic/teichoic acid biosynthesis glycosyltransferase
MVKRLLDIVFASVGLVVLAPVLLPAMVLIWLQDFRSPFYVATRIGRGGRPFRMVKLRTMVVNADAAGIDSTAANDPRITMVGRFVRACKLDELSQLWNVVRGDMSLVGPRPNVASEIERYTGTERRLLDARPGITDFSSIVFADEGEILRDSADADLDYNRLIRPWKSRLALFNLDRRSDVLDVALMMITVFGIVSRRAALGALSWVLARLDAPDELRRIARRTDALTPTAPPGADHPVGAADLGGGRFAA